MAHKKSKKDNKKLRRELEVLKAQLNIQKEPAQQTISSSQKLFIDDESIKKDLMKTFALSAIAFTVIISLWIIN